MTYGLFVLRVAKYGKIIWHFCKSNWQIVIAAIVILVVYITSRSKNRQLAKTLSDMRVSHKEEVTKIQESYDKQIEDVIQAEKTMTETIRAVEEEYKTRNQNLDRKRRKEIEVIIKENKEDPEVITKKISEITGFEIYVK
jgi:hypothetical protein|tara:strand:+ start:59 stop:478 length:420 start_codon:yes stop_codon:yes gene_type:complete